MILLIVVNDLKDLLILLILLIVVNCSSPTLMSVLRRHNVSLKGCWNGWRTLCFPARRSVASVNLHPWNCCGFLSMIRGCSLRFVSVVTGVAMGPLMPMAGCALGSGAVELLAGLFEVRHVPLPDVVCTDLASLFLEESDSVPGAIASLLESRFGGLLTHTSVFHLLGSQGGHPSLCLLRSRLGTCWGCIQHRRPTRKS